jgi:hypothetical protein
MVSWLPVGTIIVVLVSVWYILLLILQNHRHDNIHDVIVISPGGGGTTYVMQQLKKHSGLYINHVDDRDGLKHISIDRKQIIDDISPRRILYIFNDPALAIESHFRRKWPQTQLNKLGNPYHLQYLDSDGGKERFYNDCMAHNKDMYGIQRQFEFMVSGEIPCPVMCIDFVQFDRVRNEIASFLNIPVRRLDSVQVSTRNSSKHDLPAQYKTIYNSVYTTMKQYHGVVISPTLNVRHKTSLHFVTYGDSTFRRSRERIVQEV